MMRFAATLLLVPLFACSDSTPEASEATRASEGWRDVADADLDSRQRTQLDAALAARGDLFGRLSAALLSALDEGDPGDAIAVCRDLAPRLAQEIGAEHGLAIGRTSWKLRNPANAAPTWAQDLVAARVEAPRTRAHDDGRLGALLPIRVAAACLTCHAPADALSDEVRMALAEHYPEDRATGFADGDLRGWFWIEVP